MAGRCSDDAGTGPADDVELDDLLAALGAMRCELVTRSEIDCLLAYGQVTGLVDHPIEGHQTPPTDEGSGG